MSKEETLEMLSIANGMLNHVKCINMQCDGNGAIQIAEDEWEQCQWCDEKRRIQEYLNTTKQK